MCRSHSCAGEPSHNDLSPVPAPARHLRPCPSALPYDSFLAAPGLPSWISALVVIVIVWDQVFSVNDPALHKALSDLVELALRAVLEPDVALAAALVALAPRLAPEPRAAARALVQRLLERLRGAFGPGLRSTLAGSLHGLRRRRRPHRGVDLPRTVARNLRHYRKGRGLGIERLVGYGRGRGPLLDVLLCLDRSASMARSLVYAALFASLLVGLPALRTRVLAFADAVAELDAADPLALVFALRPAGGTAIARALAAAQERVLRPARTLLVLCSDLREGGAPEPLLARVDALASSGVRVLVLLALDERGLPRYHIGVAAALAARDVPCCACAPDDFPTLLAAALQGDALDRWAVA